MSLPPAAITKPETSNTASHVVPCNAARIDAGSVRSATKSMNVGRQIARGPAAIQHRDIGTVGGQSLDQPATDEDRTPQDQRLHVGTIAFRWRYDRIKLIRR